MCCSSRTVYLFLMKFSITSDLLQIQYFAGKVLHRFIAFTKKAIYISPLLVYYSDSLSALYLKTSTDFPQNLVNRWVFAKKPRIRLRSVLGWGFPITRKLKLKFKAVKVIQTQNQKKFVNISQSPKRVYDWCNSIQSTALSTPVLVYLLPWLWRNNLFAKTDFVHLLIYFTFYLFIFILKFNLCWYSYFKSDFICLCKYTLHM